MFRGAPRRARPHPGARARRGPVVVVAQPRVYRRRPVVIRPAFNPWVPSLMTILLVKKVVDKNKVKRQTEIELAKNQKMENTVVVADSKTGELIVAQDGYKVCFPDKHQIVELTEWTQVKFVSHNLTTGQVVESIAYADRRCTICNEHFFCYENAATAPQVPGCTIPTTSPVPTPPPTNPGATNNASIPGGAYPSNNTTTQPPVAPPYYYHYYGQPPPPPPSSQTPAYGQPPSAEYNPAHYVYPAPPPAAAARSAPPSYNPPYNPYYTNGNSTNGNRNETPSTGPPSYNPSYNPYYPSKNDTAPPAMPGVDSMSNSQAPKLCSNCGTALTAKFCGNCGHPATN